ncbi:MAG: cytidine deaminase [Planctomycetaceae bacterium]|nr:cytidine deaminase [Planctomycetaceae bacterium]
MTHEQEDNLIDAALAARKDAHAPYSNFEVGAAVLTASGEIFVGCNIENASFGLTNCAERTAIFSAVAAGHRSFLGLALASAGAVPPCGACRQVLAEFCEDLPIMLYDATENKPLQRKTTLVELLPDRFSA